MENTDYQLRSLIIDTHAKSLLCSTVNNRLLIRNYLTSINLSKTSAKIEYDGSGIAFASNFHQVLQSFKDFKSMIKHITKLALEIEDIASVKNELIALLETLN